MAAPYSAEGFRQRVNARLGDWGACEFGDHSFNPGLGETFKNIKRQPAAVLVPIVAHEREVERLPQYAVAQHLGNAHDTSVSHAPFVERMALSLIVVVHRIGRCRLEDLYRRAIQSAKHVRHELDQAQQRRQARLVRVKRPS